MLTEDRISCIVVVQHYKSTGEQTDKHTDMCIIGWREETDGMKTLKEKIQNCESLSGMHVTLGDACISELLGGIGFDFLWIDTEHTTIDYQTLQNHLIAARAGGSNTLVRIPWNDPTMAKRVLEMGPGGIIFPMINTAEEADAAMKSCLYPPYGTRGFGPIRAVRYGQEDNDEYISKRSWEICRCIQIETATAVKNLPEIVRNPYIDAYIFGPCDLSGSIGEINQVFGAHTTTLIDEAIHILKENGKTIGISTGACDRKTIQHWHDRGINMISAGTDHLFLSEMAKRTLSNIHGVQQSKKE